MDSEDERLIEAEESMNSPTAIFNHTSWSTSCRLFEKQEKLASMKMLPGFPKARSTSLAAAQPKDRNYTEIDFWLCKEFDGIPNYCGRIRAVRFFRTISGFHRGDLDLAGRHERRYRSLLEYWKTFSLDIAEMKANSNVEYFPHASWLSEFHGMLGILVDPNHLPDIPLWTIDDPKRFEIFLKKWKLERTWGISMFIYATDLVNCVIESGPPVFQNYHLTHLPAEILYYIMRFCPEAETRRLGTTCKLLRQFIDYTTYRLRLFQSDSNLPLSHYRSGHARMMEELQYLLLHPNICQSIRYFHLADDWQPSHPMLALEDNRLVKREEFYSPLRTGVCRVVSKLSHLTSIFVNGWHIDSSFMQAILCHAGVIEVQLRSCTTSLLLPCRTNRQTPVNLAILDITPDAEGLWNILYGFPVLRSLSVTVGLENSYGLPSRSTWEDLPANPFKEMERFIASPIAQTDLDDLYDWMRDAKGPHLEHPLRLTHFKLATTGGLERSDVRELLDALRGFPIQFLSLDCLLYDSTDLLEEIAEVFPNLISLTLQRRRSASHRNLRWSHPSWEYARSLGQFPNLRHFGWNFQHKHPYEMENPVVYSYYLQFFEIGFPPDDMWTNPDFDVEIEDNECTIARCLGTYCPSLERVAFFMPPDITIVYYRTQLHAEWDMDGSRASTNLAECLTPNPPKTNWAGDSEWSLQDDYELLSQDD